MTTARDFFRRAAEASQDAERCRRQLDAMEQRMLSLGSPGAGGRVSGTAQGDAMARRVAAYADRERALAERMERDYADIGCACLVLYGDGTRHGLDSVQSPAWADVLWWRYLDGAKWGAVARAVGYSERMCQIMHDRALEWMDEARFMSAVMDVG